tara:strand:+ start:234 stop:878 length:645 start_codon:yes stop_codon:yes gene_type:complete
MTYLQLVNAVLRRLRESEVTSVSQNTYSALIGELVNQSKRYIENAVNWSGLRSDITFNTADDDFTYTLTGATDRSTVLDVINDTSNKRLSYKTPYEFKNFKNIATSSKGSPSFFTFNGFDGVNTQVDVHPTPDGVYSLIFTVAKRPVDLSSDSDTILVPTAPVIEYAHALAARERGETGGTSAAELFRLADVTLSDAAAFDQAKNPEELVFRTI